MTASPRVLIALSILFVAFVPTPLASAGDCVEVNTAVFAEGIRVIANTGSQITLGVRSGMPGDGFAFVMTITPSVCGIGSALANPTSQSSVVPEAPSMPVLP